MNIIKTTNEFSISFQIEGYRYESWIVHQFHGFSRFTGNFREGGCAYKCDLESCTNLSDPKVFSVFEGNPLPQDIIDELKSQIEESARYYLSIPKPLPPAEFPKITFKLYGLKLIEEKRAKRKAEWTREKELNPYIPDPSKSATHNAIGAKLFLVEELPESSIQRYVIDLVTAMPFVVSKRGEIPNSVEQLPVVIPGMDKIDVLDERKINSFILQNTRENRDFLVFIAGGSMKHIKSQLQSVDLENGEHEISFTDYYPWNEFYGSGQ